MKETPDETSKRKKDHLNFCLNENVGFISKTTGFECYDFVHNAITEVDYLKIDLSASIFGKRINFPFIISSMTGGAKEAEKINSDLANIAEHLGIAMGVGSQRQALDDKSYLESYKVLRRNAPTIPLFSNIGAYQIAKNNNPVELVLRIVEMIESDAVIIHLNPLQELIQKEGETDFSGLLKNIKKITNRVNIPVIVKEVGAGISKSVAKKLLDAGVKAIDVAGAGGTSWAAVEMLRNDNKNNYFWDWGIPTSECIVEVSKLKNKYNFILIASGGIDDGIKIAKSITLGADLAASARIIFDVLMKRGPETLEATILQWFDDVKKIMYLTGCKNIKELKNKKLLRRIC